MSRTRYVAVFLSMAVLVALSLTLGGCKAQQQMQAQLAQMDERLQSTERRVNLLDSDLKKARMELDQMKSLTQKLGNVVVDLQKAEEDRSRAAAEAKAKAEADAAARKTKKPMPKKPLPKKKHR